MPVIFFSWVGAGFLVPIPYSVIKGVLGALGVDLGGGDDSDSAPRSSWKLPMVILRPGGFVTAESTMVAIIQHALGIAVGLIFMAAVLRVARRKEMAPMRNTTGLRISALTK